MRFLALSRTDCSQILARIIMCIYRQLHIDMDYEYPSDMPIFSKFFILIFYNSFAKRFNVIESYLGSTISRATLVR